MRNRGKIIYTLFSDNFDRAFPPISIIFDYNDYILEFDFSVESEQQSFPQKRKRKDLSIFPNFYKIC